MRLIETEIDLTRRLLNTTPADDPVRPDIQFRQAELEEELRDLIASEASEAEAGAIEAEESGEAERGASLRGETARLREKALGSAAKAIDSLQAIASESPDWERMDEVWLHLACALDRRAMLSTDVAERADFAARARTTYDSQVRGRGGASRP
ncbi:MAG: hypothetical protein HY905_14050 [Deltaproteobacteria bacterium]|nr:hypothetical protein [Deltaproteobacteria bacterium]